MEADAQVSQLEAALLHQAETLVREQLQYAESARVRILQDATERLRLAEEHELTATRMEAERMFRRQVQAAETRLAADLDRTRWALTEAALAGLRPAFRQMTQDQARYREVLEVWLADAARSLPAGDLVAEVRAADYPRLATDWAAIAARVGAGRRIELHSHDQISEGGIRIRLANNRAQIDQTFEARQARLANDLARVAMERLFVSAPDLGALVHS